MGNLKDRQVYNITIKPLTNTEHSLLYKGSKFGVFLLSTVSAPLIDYIIATKHVCDYVCENTLSGKTDCTEYYSKVTDGLSKFVTNPKPIYPNIMKVWRNALWDLQMDDIHIILTANKVAALVIMDMYNEKWMAPLDDHNIYKEFRDQTKSIHSEVLNSCTWRTWSAKVQGWVWKTAHQVITVILQDCVLF